MLLDIVVQMFREYSLYKAAKKTVEYHIAATIYDLVFTYEYV